MIECQYEEVVRAAVSSLQNPPEEPRLASAWTRNYQPLPAGGRKDTIDHCLEFSLVVLTRFPHDSCLPGGRIFLAPDAGESGLDLLLKASDQFEVGGDQHLLSFDLGDDGLLHGERRERNWDTPHLLLIQLGDGNPCDEAIHIHFVEHCNQESVKQECTNGAQNVSVIIDPRLAFDRIGGVLPTSPLRTILSDQNERFVEKEVLDVIENAGSSVVGIWARLPFVFGDGPPLAVEYLDGLPQLHHRPVGVNGDVGAVVVEDGASAIDDFLAALNLGHNLLLHIQRRQGDLTCVVDIASIKAGYPSAASQIRKVQALQHPIQEDDVRLTGFCLLDVVRGVNWKAVVRDQRDFTRRAFATDNDRRACDDVFIVIAGDAVRPHYRIRAINALFLRKTSSVFQSADFFESSQRECRGSRAVLPIPLPAQVVVAVRGDAGLLHHERVMVMVWIKFLWIPVPDRNIRG